jgi:hypothetical protein
VGTKQKRKENKTGRNIVAIDGTPKGHRNRYNRMQPSKIKILTSSLALNARALTLDPNCAVALFAKKKGYMFEVVAFATDGQSASS